MVAKNTLFILLLILLTSATAAFAQKADSQVREIQGVSGLEWTTSGEIAGAKLTVTGPGGFLWTDTFAPGDSLYLDYAALGKSYFPDGRYSYELVLYPAINDADKKLAVEARELGEDISFLENKTMQPASGSFYVSNAVVVDRDLPEQSLKDQVILDDLIVDGSLCVGVDCVNGESFGFDTIRLKENNLRIKFQDTSTSASFPTNDWQITINDSSNGGQNKFSIDDIDGSRTPFTIEASAPSHSLYVDDGGRIGFGTNTPVVELHVVDGDTPTMRLEQNGSSGFTPQTWDLAGNETNIFIRDATNGSSLPFRIRPGAPTSALDVAADGDIGIGTSSPTNNVTVDVVSDQAVGLRVANTGGGVALRLDAGNTADFWQITSTVDDNILRFNRTGGNTELELDSSGNLTISGEITTMGTCSVGCDRVFDENYDLPSIDHHGREMWANGYLPAIGATAEGAPMNLSDKTGRMLNELEKAHIYILQLHERLDRLEAALENSER